MEMTNTYVDSLNIDELNAMIHEANAQARKLEQMKQDQKYLMQHERKISFYDGYWCTYVEDKRYKGALRKLRAKTREGLNDKIVQFYKDCEERPTVHTAFDMWMDDREKNHEVTPQTITKMRNNFKRYFTEDNDVMQKRIEYITEGDITAFIKHTIVEHGLTRKQYSDFRTLIRGLWRYAYDKGWTDIRIVQYFQEVYLPKGLFRKVARNESDKVFTREDAEKLTSYLRASNFLTDMGILLQFETGMRVGELSALKWEDVSDEYIHVHRTEVHYNDKSGHEVKVVQDMPKSEAGDRHIIISKSAKQTIHKIRLKNPFGEYVFERLDHTRIAEGCFNRRLTVICSRLGIEKSSSHKIRRTFATTLINANADESFIKNIMGHSDISTTRKYYYFADQSYAEQKRQIESAIPF